MNRRLVYASVAVFVTMFALALLNVVYTDRVAAQSEQRNQQRAREICGLITVLDDAYQQTPPTTDVGRHMAAEVHQYRVRLGC